ncbi:hypothetical protein BDK51DRAFT_25685, partial [Blyttiomyces helicus]
MSTSPSPGSNTHHTLSIGRGDASFQEGDNLHDAAGLIGIVIGIVIVIAPNTTTPAEPRRLSLLRHVEPGGLPAASLAYPLANASTHRATLRPHMEPVPPANSAFPAPARTHPHVRFGHHIHASSRPQWTLPGTILLPFAPHLIEKCAKSKSRLFKQAVQEAMSASREEDHIRPSRAVRASTPADPMLPVGIDANAEVRWGLAWEERGRGRTGRGRPLGRKGRGKGDGEGSRRRQPGAGGSGMDELARMAVCEIE